VQKCREGEKVTGKALWDESMMIKFDQELFRRLSIQAQTADRLRRHLNFHDSYDDPSQRMLVAIEPGSYVRPHRHLVNPQPEAFLVLKGRLALITFNNDGSLREGVLLGPGEEVFGVEVQPGIWHTVIGLAPGTIFYETKPGPFRPISQEDLAPWAPVEGDSRVSAYLHLLADTVIG
jgi:cupin fold WbuC family metalloprotein